MWLAAPFVQRPITALILSAFFVLCPTYTWGDDNNTITIATIDVPPLTPYKNGLVSEIVRQAFKLENIHVEYHLYPLTRIPWALEKNKECAAIGTTRWFAKTNIEISVQHVYYGRASLFYLKENFPNGFDFNQLDEIKQYRIGTYLGGALDKFFVNNGFINNIQLVPSLHQNMKKLILGRIDFVATLLYPTLKFIEAEYPNYIDEINYAKTPLFIGQLGIIFTPRCKEMKERFTKGFYNLRQSGEYRKIIESHFHPYSAPSDVFVKLEGK
ncbi:transporter substrate-binding domain-containing protein [Vibrio profundum]|uniref:substrate-binding periplasmic protein n=1 Tax=Vibrio profundum TaxID=2910247 RepID=UPI003D0D5894